MIAPPRIDSFDLTPGRKVGPRYVVESFIGKGAEGEVYQIRELDTGIRRAAKIYFPHRDPQRKTLTHHAQKLHVLRHCPIVLQYHHSELIHVRKRKAVAMISELCEGEQLERWIARHPGGRLHAYRALCVVDQLVRGLEAVHALGEYHADVHSQNILIRPLGIRFEIKLVDFYDWGKPTRYKQRQDITDCLRILLECLGGQKHYAKQPPEIKHIVANLRSDLIRKRFPTMTALRKHMESFPWQSTL